MTHRNIRNLTLCCALAFPLAALADGRTDGPEGSEIGKGGYERVGGGNYSLGLDWGYAGGAAPASPGAPLFVGLTGSYWADDWFLIDVSASYLFYQKNFDVLAGPRMRTTFYPVSTSLGLKAGATFASDGALRFGLQPNVGADILLGRVTLGLFYAPDILFSNPITVAHKIGMNIGMRF